MLSDVIRNIIERQPDMKVVGEVIDPIDLLIAIHSIQSDVIIITPISTNGMPRICHQLLSTHPKLRIITLAEDGESALLYQSNSASFLIKEPSEQSIVRAIRGDIQDG